MLLLTLESVFCDDLRIYEIFSLPLLQEYTDWLIKSEFVWKCYASSCKKELLRKFQKAEDCVTASHVNCGGCLDAKIWSINL